MTPPIPVPLSPTLTNAHIVPVRCSRLPPLPPLLLPLAPPRRHTLPQHLILNLLFFHHHLLLHLLSFTHGLHQIHLLPLSPTLSLPTPLSYTCASSYSCTLSSNRCALSSPCSSSPLGCNYVRALLGSPQPVVPPAAA